MTPQQCLMARAALGLSHAETARAAGVGVSTVARLEAGRSPISATVSAIRRAFEDRGVIFLGDGELTPGGPGVRLRATAADGVTDGV